MPAERLLPERINRIRSDEKPKMKSVAADLKIPRVKIKMHSTIDNVESPLDVVVYFSEEDWVHSKRDLSWATSMVIEELKRYKPNPEEYFATKPGWVVKMIPWGERIRLEIMGHIWTNDRSIRFSEWWIVKLIR